MAIARAYVILNAISVVCVDLPILDRQHNAFINFHILDGQHLDALLDGRQLILHGTTPSSMASLCREALRVPAILDGQQEVAPFIDNLETDGVSWVCVWELVHI